MKIAQVLVGLYDGGVTTHSIELSNGLVEKGNEVIIICQKGSDKYENILNSMGVKRYYLNFNIKKNPFEFFKVIKLLKEILIKEKIDVIHSHYRIPNIFIQILSNSLKIPYVWTYHLSGVNYSGLSKLLSFHGNRTIAVSKECKDDLIERFKLKEDKIEVILNGVDLDKYINYDSNIGDIKKKFNIPESSYVISILARIVEEKAQKETILALHKILKDNDNIYLVLAGSEDLNNPSSYELEVINITKKYKIESKVKLVGFQKPQEILAMSNLMLLPSFIEGFGIVCIEAMAMKVPVLRSKTAGWQEMKECCELIEIGDKEELRNKVSMFIKNEINVKRMCTNAFSYVLNNCRSEKMVDKILVVYDSVIKDYKR